MNLRVDLILPTERRSGSRITVASVVRIVSVGVPAILAALIFWAVVRLQTAQSEVRVLQANWDRLAPHYKEALSLKEDLARQRAVREEIESWNKARVVWHEQLAALQTAVPPQVQLTELRVDDLIQTISNRPMRVFRMEIRGKTSGAGAEEYVGGLMAHLTREPFAPGVKSAEIPPGSFGQDPSPTASKMDRVFQIVCKYTPLELE